MKNIIEKANEILTNQDFSDEKIISGGEKLLIKEIIIKKINSSPKKQDSDENNKAWFIDGGIATGYYAKTLAIAKIRIAAVEYDANKKTRTNSSFNEFSALAYIENEEIKIITEPVQQTKIFLKKSQNNESTKDNSILNTLNQLRRNSEIDCMLKLSEENKPVILDGPLIREEDDEQETNKLFASKNAQILGIIKSTDDYTNKGRNACYAMSRQIKQKEPWFCVVAETEIITGYVKLSKNSRLILKFQATKSTNLEKMFELISELSNDSVFPGYPYGLIEADELARISNNEKEEFASSIMSMTKQQKELQEAEEMSKPHDILDNIKF